VLFRGTCWRNTLELEWYVCFFHVADLYEHDQDLYCVSPILWQFGGPVGRTDMLFIDKKEIQTLLKIVRSQT
jgi:hypothetical protein